jgi:hypothetical protein
MVSSFFSNKSVRDKINILYEKGTFIVGIRYYGYKINLFLLRDTYVEVFYNHKYDCIEKIQKLDQDHSRMKFYCDQIKIPTI